MLTELPDRQNAAVPLPLPVILIWAASFAGPFWLSTTVPLLLDHPEVGARNFPL
jgi:hypothetical protein